MDTIVRCSEPRPGISDRGAEAGVPGRGIEAGVPNREAQAGTLGRGADEGVIGQGAEAGIIDRGAEACTPGGGLEKTATMHHASAGYFSLGSKFTRQLGPGPAEVLGLARLAFDPGATGRAQALRRLCLH